MKQYIIYENIGCAYGFVHLVAEYEESVGHLFTWHLLFW
jgi:hypothetical protein